MISAKTQPVNEENVTKEGFVITSLECPQPIDIVDNNDVTNLTLCKNKENSRYGIIEESSSRLDTTSSKIQRISRYNHQDHYHLIEEWSAYWNAPVTPKELFFDLGYVVNNVAIGFLVLTNSKQAWIDHLIASPFVEPELRDKSLDLLFDTLEDEARRYGCITLNGLVRLSAVNNRVVPRGYISQGTYNYHVKLLVPLTNPDPIN